MKLDQRLRDQHFYTRSLLESNIDALMTTDPRGIVTDVNKQMEELTGCTRDELIGAPFKSYFTDPERAEAGINRVLNEGKVLFQGDAHKLKAHRAGNSMKLEAVVVEGADAFETPTWAESLQVKEAELTVTFDREFASDALRWAADQHEARLLGEYALTEITLEDMYIDLVGKAEATHDAN